MKHQWVSIEKKNITVIRNEISFWTKSQMLLGSVNNVNNHFSEEKILPSDKYKITEVPINEYTKMMELTILTLRKDDFGSYTCISDNALGIAEAKIGVQGKLLFLS